jgi:tellurium resistance protein TerZ
VAVSAIQTKLGLRNRTEIAVWAWENRVVETGGTPAGLIVEAVRKARACGTSAGAYRRITVARRHWDGDDESTRGRRGFRGYGLLGRGIDVSANLSRGEKIPLHDRGGLTPTLVRMSLGWDMADPAGRPGRSSSRIDLDASALLIDDEGRLVDQVWYGQLTSRDGSVRHTGDNITGQGEGDLESIRIDLSRVPANVAMLVFTVNSFTGQDFSQVENAYCRLLDETDDEVVIASYDLTDFGPHTAQIMVNLNREGAGWSMTALGIPAGGATYRDLLTVLSAHLGIPLSSSSSARRPWWRRLFSPRSGA